MKEDCVFDNWKSVAWKQVGWMKVEMDRDSLSSWAYSLFLSLVYAAPAKLFSL